MKPSLLFLVSLCAVLAAPSCTKPAENVRAQPASTTKANEGPQVGTGTVPEPALSAPAANQTLYKIYVKNEQGQSLVGVTTMLLSEVPEGLYISEPRRRFVIGTYKTPAYGRVHYLVESDSKPKYLWLGRNGVMPFVVELEPSAPGQTYQRTVATEIWPVATLIIQDHEGMRVSNAIVTMKPEGDAGKYASRLGSGNYGNTKRSNSMGEVRFTRPPGKYRIIANKENGTSRVERIMDWTGNLDPVAVSLPVKSEAPSQG